MSVSIVLGSADRVVTEQFRSQIAENLELEVVDIVEDGRHLIETVDRTEADVLVLHESLGPIPALEMVRETAMSRPYLGIVLVVAEGNSEIYAQAMEAGARSVLTTPFSHDEVSERLEAAAGWGRLVRSHLSGEINAQGSGRSTVVTVSGSKGGVGSTLIASVLALAAQRAGTKTCLVDLNLQSGDVGHLIGVQSRRSVVDLAEVSGEINVRSVNETVFRDPSGLHVLVAPDHGERSEDMSTRSARLILSTLRLQYDLVVIDCGSHVDDATAIAVEQSDVRLLVVTPDILSLRAGRRRLEMFERLQIAKPEDVSVVLNQAARKHEIQPDAAAQILGQPLVEQTLQLAERETEELSNTGRLGDARGGRWVSDVVNLGASLEIVPRQAQAAPRKRRRRREAGQVMLETPVIIGLLLLFTLFLFQMLAWGWTHVIAQNAVQEAARVASVDDDRATCDAASDRMSLGFTLEDCSVSRTRDRVFVEVDTPTIVPGLGSLTVSSDTSFVEEER